MKIPNNIIIKSELLGVNKVNWYIHCGDHIMARKPITDSYIIIHNFNAYKLEELSYYVNIARIHNENLILGLTDIQYNRSLD